MVLKWVALETFHPVFLLPVNEIGHSVSTVFPNSIASTEVLMPLFSLTYVSTLASRLAGKTTLISFVSEFPLRNTLLRIYLL